MYVTVQLQLLDILRHRRGQLRDYLLIESVDDVDKDGYGAIHYVVTKQHKNKPLLLEMLVIQEEAHVDLTTIRQRNTALHLAIDVSHS